NTFLFFLLMLIARNSRIVKKLKMVPKYDVWLVGEVHSYGEEFGFGSEEAYEKEIEKELYLIENVKPDYLFLEVDEKRLEEFKEKQSFKKIYETAKKVGSRIVPMEEPYSLENAIKIVEKLQNLKKIIENINYFLFFLVDAYFDRDLKKLEDAKKLLFSPITVYELNVPRNLYLYKILGIEELSEKNLKNVYELTNRKKEEFYKKLEFYQKEKFKDVYFDKREENWARLIAKIHKNNPKVRSMVIIGENHISSKDTIFPELLKKYGLRYKTTSMTDEIKKEKEKNQIEMYKRLMYLDK
ncbi:MAG: hypothetical protein QW412_02250, partial [Candidatus Aenigmatarchaeota archaeon]